MRQLYSLLLGCLGLIGVYGQEPNDHIFPAAAAARQFINFDKTGFFVNGKRTFLVSAGLEYARVPRALWADRLLRLQRGGFNCVEVYTFWNYHEPQEGVFNFSGEHDLDAFLRLVKKMGMYAIVRVGPYYCAEWDNGGYPLWLKFKPGLRVREPNAVFEKYAGLFFDKLFPIVSANQVHRGGAVIMVQLENEHPAGWGTDMPNSYFTFLRDKALSLGLEVPYFFSGLHHASDPAAGGDTLSLDDPARPNPWFSTEFWSVWYNGYGSGEKEARLFERRTWKIIANGGGGYNYYMAHGGSNFGFTNNDEDAASYDYGAAVGQGGDLRPIYYGFKRAALFARSFAEELGRRGRWGQQGERGEGVQRGEGGQQAQWDEGAQRDQWGERRGIEFLDNPSDTVKIVVRPSGDTVVLEPGEIMPVVHSLVVGPVLRTGAAGSGKAGAGSGAAALKLEGNTARILAVCRQKKMTTLLVYGKAGSSVVLNFSTGVLRFVVPNGIEPEKHMAGPLTRVLVMNKETADRCWIIGDTIVVGPRYVGEMRVKGGKISMVTEDTVGTLVYTAEGVRRLARPNGVRSLAGWSGLSGEIRGSELAGMDKRGVIGSWAKEWVSGVAATDYIDTTWKYSEWPLQMGADRDTSANAWYRTRVTVDEAGLYTLLVEGADRATVFVDGQRIGAVDIKEGAIPLRLTKGGHVVAVFTSHDGRDKLAAYIGGLDSVARKGLYGRALLVKGEPAITTLTDWRVLKGGEEKALPEAAKQGWKPYKIGEDVFDKKQGVAWFETVLPDMPAGVRQAELRFASVDENAVVFINGRRILRHDGWNSPFTILMDRIDTMQRPIRLTLFVENYSNEGGIDQAVRFSPWVAPMEVKGWRMTGGVGDSRGTIEGPCWWKTNFTVPANPGWVTVWRVIPEGLGHGSVWVNQHNLGRYPEKIPVKGLYIPECWLVKGKNSLFVFDEDGKDKGQVRIEAEAGASRPVNILQER
jgi:beta-galactosidase